MRAVPLRRPRCPRLRGGCLALLRRPRRFALTWRRDLRSVRLRPCSLWPVPLRPCSRWPVPLRPCSRWPVPLRPCSLRLGPLRPRTLRPVPLRPNGFRPRGSRLPRRGARPARSGSPRARPIPLTRAAEVGGVVRVRAVVRSPILPGAVGCGLLGAHTRPAVAARVRPYPVGRRYSRRRISVRRSVEPRPAVLPGPGSSRVRR